MPAQESAEPETPQETEISIQTGVYTGMLIAAAVCMAAACAFTYFSQSFYELDEGTKSLKVPVFGEAGEAGLKSVRSSATAEEEKGESATEEKAEESKPAEEKTEEAKPAGEKKEEAKPAEETKEK